MAERTEPKYVVAAMALQLRVGTVPILWNNDDVPELTPAVPYERVLAEMAEAGFEGTELGSNYPKDARTLRAALGQAGLKLSGGYFCGEFRNRASHGSVLDKAERHAAFLAEVGAGYLVVADELHPERERIAGRAKLEDAMKHDELAAFSELLQKLGGVARRAGLDMVFHNHAGTYVERPDELERLLAATDASVGLCLDTGHCLFGGGNPVELIRRHGNRLRYVHLKDVDPAVLDKARAERAGFLDCLRGRVFTEVGQGMLDLEGVLTALSGLSYGGWLVCEQDTSHRKPLESAVIARQNLARAIERVGASEKR